MKVRVVEEVITTNTAGQVVESVPVHISEDPVDGHSPVTLEEDAAGVPVRIVDGVVAENSAGALVDSLVVTGISAP